MCVCVCERERERDKDSTMMASKEETKKQLLMKRKGGRSGGDMDGELTKKENQTNKIKKTQSSNNKMGKKKI